MFIMKTTISVLSSTYKHLLHCTLMITIIVLVEILCGGIKISDGTSIPIDPWDSYGTTITIILYFLRLPTILTLPQTLFNFIGLLIYNAFPDKVILKGHQSLVPFLCFRVVTRGDFPHLVARNVQRNLNGCLDLGLEKFTIEVVTDKPINLPVDNRIRELVVPSNYRTKTGALFKSRALQYCLEDGVNKLDFNDWIIHLDEETLLTENSLRGIINFVLDGKHAFGQGLITYANGTVINWITTLADSFRVSDDMGKLRLQFKMFHKPLFSLKGSYVVSQVKAERHVSFDNGLDGSIAEDCYFAMRAFSLGYTFNFIEGEMFEKSPFTLMDFLQQRKRWIQGILLVVHSNKIPFKYKVCLAFSVYAWVTLPLSTASTILAIWYPIQCSPFVDFVCAFIPAVYVYLYVFGVLKSFSLYSFGGVWVVIGVIGAILTQPINLVIENLAVIWGVFGHKHKFYVVQKDFHAMETV